MDETDLSRELLICNIMFCSQAHGFMYCFPSRCLKSRELALIPRSRGLDIVDTHKPPFVQPSPLLLVRQTDVEYAAGLTTVVAKWLNAHPM
jgi:hypothetical protein